MTLHLVEPELNICSQSDYSDARLLRMPLVLATIIFTQFNPLGTRGLDKTIET